METNWIENLLIIILIVIFIILIARVFGNSPTDIQIYSAFFSGLIAIATYAASIHKSFSDHIIKLNREVGEIKTQMINSFKRVREDISEIKGKLK